MLELERFAICLVDIYLIDITVNTNRAYSPGELHGGASQQTAGIVCPLEDVPRPMAFSDDPVTYNHLR